MWSAIFMFKGTRGKTESRWWYCKESSERIRRSIRKVCQTDERVHFIWLCASWEKPPKTLPSTEASPSVPFLQTSNQNQIKLSHYKDHEGDVWSVSPSSELFLDGFRFARLALIYLKGISQVFNVCDWLGRILSKSEKSLSVNSLWQSFTSAWLAKLLQIWLMCVPRWVVAAKIEFAATALGLLPMI